MTTDDPFFDADGDDSDRTVIRPMPGGRRPGAGPATPRTEPPPMQPRTPVPPPAHYAVDRGLNPLVTAAAPLLSLLGKLRNAPSHPDVNGLRRRMEDELRAFERRAVSAGIDQENVFAARYTLCTVIDETVLNTPWGSNSPWSTESLLILFHKEAWGGEKFFQMLERMLKDPARFLEMLELMYICLSMGFEGKYRIIEGGSRTLEQIRDSVYRTIRMQRGEYEQDLSVHWRGEQMGDNTLRHYIPLWVVAALSGVLLLSTFLVFSYFINDTSAPVFKEVYAVGRETPPEIDSAPPPPPPVKDDLYDRVSGFLEPEVREGLVELINNDSDVVIRLRNKGLFGSGSDQVKPGFRPLLQRIAEALAANVDGPVLVAGHSDNIPIHTLRFPSNWHLSMGRAESVAEILRQDAAIKGEIVADGRADNEPRVPNDSSENRARNRRVEIILEK
ncbi:type VI secretion system protein TssL [bacterium endosymbiont of Escarpia laminata]|nr:MAG: type VI secretion system protein TssL [bacterium endosymbiont of Escarpia laminata]